MSTNAPTPITATEGLPESLKSVRPLWEANHGGSPQQPGLCTRLYDNGALYSWSNARRAMKGSNPTRLPAPYAWRLDAKVSPEGVKRVHALAASEFAKVPAEAKSAPGADQGLIAYHAHADRVDHTVVVPSSAMNKLPKAVQEIESAIQSHIIPGGAPMDQK